MTTQSELQTTNALAVIDMDFDGNIFKADFDGMEKAARLYAKQFDNLPIVTEDDRKQAKTFKADINNRIKEINASRIALYKRYDEPKAPFTARCDGIIAILNEQAEYIDAGLKRKDKEFLGHREALLLQEYEAIAKELMPHIPLDVFTRADTKLLGRTRDDEKACKALGDMIITAVRDREAIKASCQEFHVEADMEYCRTLDIHAALDKNKQLADGRMRREEHERMMREVALVDEPAPEPKQEIKPAPSHYPSPAKRKGEPVCEWCFGFLATRSQAESLAAYARTLGIKSDGIKKARKSK
ncbi:DUF1351 domain-containing protein [Gordonibacter sp.]|uniref:DUF1351 domain-containing protein n=1 Tax=Gordonibacter sp. TaxID=1968902 RepID=UPI002FCB0357